jgi:apolipoprotein N-acyltransferase
MDAILNYIAAHQVMFIIGASLIVVLFLNFTFKSLAKFIWIVLFILLAVFGYYYFKDKDSTTDETHKSTEVMQSFIDDIKAKSKSIWEDTKDLYRKSKAAPKEMDKLLDASDKELDKEFKNK